MSSSFLENPNMNDSQIRKSIQTLDFEEAERLSNENKKNQSDQLNQTTNDFLKYNESVKREAQCATEIACLTIELHVDDQIRKCVTDYFIKYQHLKEEQFEEIEACRSEWIDAHEMAEGIGKEKVNNQLFTSQVLASNKIYVEAKTVRDKAYLDERKTIKDETDRIDKPFKARFEKMLKRHKFEIDALYNEMIKEIDLIKSGGEVEKKAQKNQEKVELARTTVDSLSDVAKSNSFSHVEKQSIISELSPKKKN